MREGLLRRKPGEALSQCCHLSAEIGKTIEFGPGLCYT